MSLSIVIGDITTFKGDALINAANPQMLGGGGVDGAVHRVAGPRLRDRCEAVPSVCDIRHRLGTPDEPEGGFPGAVVSIRCPAGQARPVPATGTGLGVKWVINTVGPIMALDRAGALRAGEQVAVNDAEAWGTLTSAFGHALSLAASLGVRTLAVPAVGTGVYGVPHEMCARAFMESLTRLDADIEVTVYLMGKGLKEGDLGAWYHAAKLYDVELDD